MNELKNFRAKYPQYNDLDDSTLGNMLAKKYPDAYGDLAVGEDNQGQQVPEWGVKNPNLYGIYGAGKALIDTAVRPTVEATGMALGSLGSPILGTAIGYGIADKGMDMVSDAYNKLGNESVPQRTIPGELIDSAVTVGALATMNKAFDIAAPTLDIAGKYLFDKLPKELYGSAIKFPLSKKWVKTLPGKELSKRTAVVEEGLKSRVPPSEFGVNKAKFLEKEVRSHIDEVTGLLSENPNLRIKVDDVLKNGLKRAYERAGKSSDKIGNEKIIKKIAENFKQSHGEYITPSNANAIKRELYKEVNWGEGVDRITEESIKGIANNLMKSLEKRYPELKNLNQKDMERIGLIEGLERAVGRNANNNMVGLGSKMLLSNPATWPLAFWEATIGHPQIKARIAFMLAKANPTKYSKFIYPEKPIGYKPPDKILEKLIYKYKKGANPEVIKKYMPKIREQSEAARLKKLEKVFSRAGVYNPAMSQKPYNIDERIIKARGLMDRTGGK